MRKKKKYRLLVVDDDQDILELLRYNLEKEGYKVKLVADSAKAIDTALEFHPDLIILDIMMPHPNGIKLCRDIRKLNDFRNTYIFFLTAKSEGYYQQAALDTGGDDFIEKVMGLRALTQKVATVLRKKFTIRKSIAELRVGNLIINRRSQTVLFQDKRFELSRPEFELLFFLAQNPGKEIAANQLMGSIWGSENFIADGSIEMYIQNLTQKLGFNLIHRTPDYRYRFNSGVV
ncbi:MAG: response regulator transcription factor [Flammeovirgaceae bacterium]|nr:MAG: response regulator transcription factor [Flammeovirgaceae bacterium]